MSVRKDRLPMLRRPWYGHNQLASRQHFGFPNPAGDGAITEYEYLDSALGHFAMGTQARVVATQLDASIEYLLKVGVENIQAYRQPLIDYLQDELPSLGYAPITPRDAGSSIVSFRHEADPEAMVNKLRAENITITGISRSRMRRASCSWPISRRARLRIIPPRGSGIGPIASICRIPAFPSV